MSEKMEKIYALIYKDGMTQKEACRKHGVPKTTFATWKWKAYPKTPRRKWQEDDYNSVLDAMNQGIKQKEACRDIGMPVSTFLGWFKKYKEKNGYENIKKWEEDDYNTVLDAMNLGIKQKEACKDIGMPVSTFSVWFKKYKEENGYEKSVDYI